MKLGRELGCLLVLVAGCARHSEVRPDKAASLLPERYPSTPTGAGGSDVAVERYWTSFGSTELNGLVDMALTRNQDLAATEARVREAGFGARVAWSERLPTVTYDASLARVDQAAGAQARGPQGWGLSLGVAGHYELDLWGRLEAAHSASVETFQAAQWDFHTVQMTLAAETTLRWIDARAAHAQLALLDSQVQRVADLTRLLELRVGQGAAQFTDVLAQRQTTSRLEASRAVLRRSLSDARAELRVLTGGAEPPQFGESVTLPAAPPLPAAGLPADLITRRPDVRAAWHRVLSADSRAASAAADRAPSLRLEGFFGFAAATPSALFQSWISSLMAGLAGPLLDFQGRENAERQALAGAEAELAGLRQVLLEAFRDVERALGANRHLAELGHATHARVALARARSQQIATRYRNGTTPFIEFHLAEQDRLDAERADLAARSDLLLHRVQLARALGGGWSKP